MSYVIADPQMMTAAAADLAAIASNVNAAHLTAAAPTTALLPAAADEVSASIAHLFSQHAANYQALAGQAAAFQQQFVQRLTASAGWYAATEAANAAVLQPLTAIAGSFTSTVAALPGQILNLLLNSVNAAWWQVVWPLVRQLVQQLVLQLLQVLFFDLIPGYFDLILGYTAFLANVALLPSTIPNPLLQALVAGVITQLLPLFEFGGILILLPLLPFFALAL